MVGEAMNPSRLFMFHHVCQYVSFIFFFSQLGLGKGDDVVDLVFLRRPRKLVALEGLRVARMACGEVYMNATDLIVLMCSNFV